MEAYTICELASSAILPHARTFCQWLTSSTMAGNTHFVTSEFDLGGGAILITGITHLGLVVLIALDKSYNDTLDILGDDHVDARDKHSTIFLALRDFVLESTVDYPAAPWADDDSCLKVLQTHVSPLIRQPSDIGMTFERYTAGTFPPFSAVVTRAVLKWH